MSDIRVRIFSSKKVIFRTDEGEFEFLFSKREVGRLKDAFKFSKKYYDYASKNSSFLEQLGREKINIDPFKRRIEKYIDHILFPLGLSQKQVLGGIQEDYFPFDFVDFSDITRLENNYHAIIRVLNKLDEQFQRGEIYGPEYTHQINYYRNLLESNYYGIMKVLSETKNS